MTRLLSLACVSILALDSVGAPIRRPAGLADPPEVSEITIARIKSGTGAVFGNWHIWGVDVKPLAGVEDGGPAIVLINQTSGAVLYVPWTSNGWINYRNPEGKWFVAFNTGPPSPQDRADLRVEQYNGRRPEHRLATRQHDLDDSQQNLKRERATWKVTINPDTVEFNLLSGRSRITIERTGVDFTFNNRTFGAKK